MDDSAGKGEDKKAGDERMEPEDVPVESSSEDMKDEEEVENGE